MSIFNMYEKEEVELIGKENILIIQGVQNYKFLYDKNCPKYTQTARLDAFKDISLEMKKILDIEITPEEIDRRWTSMRKGYVKSLSNGGNYYLHKYLNFLRPHIRKFQINNPRPYVPIKIQGIEKDQNVQNKVETITSSLSENDSPQTVSDKANTYIKKSTEVPGLHSEESFKISISMQKEAATSYHGNDGSVDDILSQDDYFQDLNNLLLKVPKEEKVSCLIEVLQAIEYFTHFLK